MFSLNFSSKWPSSCYPMDWVGSNHPILRLPFLFGVKEFRKHGEEAGLRRTSSTYDSFILRWRVKDNFSHIKSLHLIRFNMQSYVCRNIQWHRKMSRCWMSLFDIMTGLRETTKIEPTDVSLPITGHVISFECTYPHEELLLWRTGVFLHIKCIISLSDQSIWHSRSALSDRLQSHLCRMKDTI